MDAQQTCPRRMSEFGPWQREGGLDRWTTGHGLVGQDAIGLSCSFCGSLNPDRFMELVREGWIVAPTDKNYKAYIGSPLSDEEREQRKERWISGFTYDEIVAAARERGETPEQYRAALAESYAEAFGRSEASATQAKFYLQHLSTAQQEEFIELYNSKQMRVAGGGFYVLPYFAGVRSE